MRSAPFVILGCSALFSQVSCLAPRTLPLSQLLARQIDPTSCNQICSAILNTVQTCQSPDCLCTPANANQLGQCVNCTYNAPGADATIQSQAVNTLNIFEATCAGFSLPPISITSAGASSTPASASRSSSTASRSGSVTYSISNSDSAIISTVTSTITSTSTSTISRTSAPSQTTATATQVVISALSSSSQSTASSPASASQTSSSSSSAAIKISGNPVVAGAAAFSFGFGMLFTL